MGRSRNAAGAMTAAALLVLAVGACDADRAPSVARSQPRESASPPANDETDDRTLLVDEAAVGRGEVTDVSGVLRLNSQGCYSLDSAVLVAPYGAILVDETGVVRLRGFGAFRLGDRVSANGTRIRLAPDSPPSRFTDCMASGSERLALVTLVVN